MSTSSKTTRVLRHAAAGAMIAVLSVGAASAASADPAPDQHSGGVSPNTETVDPGAQVLGVTLRQPAASRGALPLTGSDIAGLTALGLAAVAVGSTAVVGSRRRAVRATA